MRVGRCCQADTYSGKVHGYKMADGDHVVAVGAGRDPEDGVGSGDELGAGPETRTESDDREGSPFVR